MELWTHAIQWQRRKDAESAFRAGKDAPEATVVATGGGSTFGGSDRSQGVGVGTSAKTGEHSVRSIVDHGKPAIDKKVLDPAVVRTLQFGSGPYNR